MAILTKRQNQELTRLQAKLQDLYIPKFADKFFVPLNSPAPAKRLKWIQDVLEKGLYDPKELKALTKSQREKVQVWQGQLRQILSEMLKVLRNENGEYTRSES
jgi:hypothetical protein